MGLYLFRVFSAACDILIAGLRSTAKALVLTLCFLAWLFVWGLRFTGRFILWFLAIITWAGNLMQFPFCIMMNDAPYDMPYLYNPFTDRWGAGRPSWSTFRIPDAGDIAWGVVQFILLLTIFTPLMCIALVIAGYRRFNALVAEWRKKHEKQ